MLPNNGAHIWPTNLCKACSSGMFYCRTRIEPSVFCIMWLLFLQYSQFILYMCFAKLADILVCLMLKASVLSKTSNTLGPGKQGQMFSFPNSEIKQK